MKIILRIGLALSLMMSIGFGYSKSDTKVIGFTTTYPIKHFKNKKYKYVIQTTGTNRTIYRICEKISSKKIRCHNINVKGVVKEIVNFDLSKHDKKIHGEYKKFYSAYGYSKGCAQKLWDKRKYTFYYVQGEKCEDKSKLKYDGEFKMGKKYGVWKTYNKDGSLKSSQDYSRQY
jgi:hypothetical protein